MHWIFLINSVTVICFAFQTTSLITRVDSPHLFTRTKCNLLPAGLNQFAPEVSLTVSNDINQVQSMVMDQPGSTTSLPSGEPLPTVEGLSPEANVAIFIIGIIPFIWATYEFWSRIAVGASFGTGSDSIQIRPSTTTIGRDGDRRSSRGQQILGDDALIVAYFLFAVAIGSVSIAVYSVITSPAL